jgi:deazaflavin-dependent oxidoreductase (nitroreductase family)
MESAGKDALVLDRTIDITTTGRKTSQPRRMEIWYRRINDRVFITGMPGTRSWLANLYANPEFSFHLSEGEHMPARARVITDAAEHTQVLAQLLDDPFSTEFEEWVANSPLVGGEFL